MELWKQPKVATMTGNTNKGKTIPVFKAFVPDPEDETKLVQIGVTKPFKSGKGFRLCGDDTPCIRQLAYENIHNMVFLVE